MEKYGARLSCKSYIDHTNHRKITNHTCILIILYTSLYSLPCGINVEPINVVIENHIKACTELTMFTKVCAVQLM